MDGIPKQRCWDTQNEMIFFGRKDFDSKWIPEKIHQCIGSVPSSVFLQIRRCLLSFPLNTAFSSLSGAIRILIAKSWSSTKDESFFLVTSVAPGSNLRVRATHGVVVANPSQCAMRSLKW